MVGGLGEKPASIIGELYGRLSQNVHQRVEYTDSGRAIEEGVDMFERPVPILRQSLFEFLDEFQLAMDVGVITLLNQLARNVPNDQFRKKCRQLLSAKTCRVAELRHSTKLLKRWGG